MNAGVSSKHLQDGWCSCVLNRGKKFYYTTQAMSIENFRENGMSNAGWVVRKFFFIGVNKEGLSL